MIFGNNNQQTKYGKCRYEIGVYVDGAITRIFRTDVLDLVPVLISQAKGTDIDTKLKSPSEEIFKKFEGVEPLYKTK